MSQSQLATVHYHVATYSGDVHVNCNDLEDDTIVIARAKRQLQQRCGGSLPFGSQSWRVSERREVG